MADGAFLPWDVLAGLLVAAALTGVAGHLTGALLYTRNQFRRHKVLLFDPEKGAIPTVKRELEAKIEEVKASIPNVPTVAEIVAAIPIPEVPNVPTVEEIAAKFPVPPSLDGLKEELSAEIVRVFEQRVSVLKNELAEHTGQMLRAYLASQRAEFAAYFERLKQGGAMGDDPMMMILSGFASKKEAAALVGLKKYYDAHKQQKNGGTPQGGYPYGTVMNGYVATPQGWVPIAAAAPPPTPALDAPLTEMPELPLAKDVDAAETGEAVSKPTPSKEAA